MIQKLKFLIKNSSLLGSFFLVSALIAIKLLQLFIRPLPESIIFMSYGGRQFSDSPAEVYLKMLADPAFNNWTYKWGINNPEKFHQIPDSQKVNSNSLTFFYHLLRSKYWVSNSSIDRLVPFKHSRNIYIQLWHGIPLKTLGLDEHHQSPIVKSWYRHVGFDYLFTYGSYDSKKMRHIFPNTKNIKEVGLLRKAILTRRSKKSTSAICKELGISDSKPILLYVPSFRGYNTNQKPFLTDETLMILARDYTIIYRGHYYTEKDQRESIKEFADVSLYKLMLISNLMVTDYSSVIFDYLPLRRPIYLIQKDLQEYSEKRGLYLKGEDLSLPVAYSEAELIYLINSKTFNGTSLDILLKKYNPQPEERSWNEIKKILLK